MQPVVRAFVQDAATNAVWGEQYFWPIKADYRDGVLRLVIPVAEKAKPRKITISSNGKHAQAIDA